LSIWSSLVVGVVEKSAMTLAVAVVEEQAVSVLELDFQ